MAQTTWVCNKDTRVARRQSDNLDQGAGASPALPFGYYSGYIYQALLGFSQNIDDYTIIDKAVLWVRTSDQYYVAFGSDPDMNIHLLEENWDEGDSVGLSTSNGDGPVYGQISVDSVAPVTGDVTPSINTWDSFDITTLIQRAKALGDFKGLRLSGASTSSSDVGEIWAREKGTSYRAYIVVDYTNNRAPNAPSLTSPASGTKYGSASVPTFGFTGSDPDAGDTQQAYQIEVSTSSTFASFVWQSGWATTGQTGFAVSRAYGGPALTPGTTYYWRARTRDAALVTGAWSSSRTFIINALPVISDANLPYAKANHVAPIHNLSDKVTTLTPKPQFVFKPTAVDGEAITGYQVEVTGVGTDTATGSWASGTAITHKFSFALTNLTSYQVRFRARDAFEGYGPWSNYTTFAVKYMQVIYQYNIPGASGLAISLGTVTGTSAFAYRTATGASGAGASAWSASVPSSVAAYLNIMVRLASSGTAPAQPKLTSLGVTYYAATLLPYAWTLVGTGWGLDESMRKFGTKSLAGVGQATQAFAQQIISGLSPDTDYVATQWLHIEDYAGPSSGAGTGLLVTDIDYAGLGSDYLYRNTDGWERRAVRFRTGGDTTVRFLNYIAAGVSAATKVHFDAVMLSEGTVAPPWSPGLLGAPAIVDSRGIDIDGSKGGMFRLQGSAGGSHDIVELGSRGLVFGGVTHFYDIGTGEMYLNNMAGGNSVIRTIGNASDTVGTYVGYLVNRGGDTSARMVLGYAGDQQQTGIFIGPGNAARDTFLWRAGVSILETNSRLDFSGVAGLNMNGNIIEFTERADPANAAVNVVRLYARDNGSGKTQLVARFNTGVAVVIATQV